MQLSTVATPLGPAYAVNPAPPAEQAGAVLPPLIEGMKQAAGSSMLGAAASVTQLAELGFTAPNCEQSTVSVTPVAHPRASGCPPPSSSEHDP